MFYKRGCQEKKLLRELEAAKSFGIQPPATEQVPAGRYRVLYERGCQEKSFSAVGAREKVSHPPPATEQALPLKPVHRVL